MRRVVMIGCAALMLVPIYVKSRTSQDIPARAAFHVLSSGRLSIKVSGEVLHPGVYEVPANSLAASVIKMAGPLRPLARHEMDPIAAGPLRNGSELKLVLQADGSLLVLLGKMKVPELQVLGIPLYISAMSEADFDCLPGIGPALAKRIVQYRQNNGGILRVEDLSSVEGIGEKKSKILSSYFKDTVITK